MKVAIYCRVSTEDQKDRETIVTQREFARRHCETHGHTIHEFYEDDGVSATKYPLLSQRPAGSRLLEDARAGRFAAVLVYKLDRLGRGARNVLEAVEEVEQFVPISSLTEQFDPKTPSGKLLRTIMAGTGEYERDTFVERSTEATNRLARGGQWMGGITPYGYRVFGFKREARLVVSDEPIEGLEMSEVDVVSLIFRMSAEEGKSCNAIADHLNALGVPPAYTRDGREVLRGKRKETTQGIWRYGRVGNMLKNPTYKGIHFYGRRSAKKREVIERAVPAIVSPAQWDKAQETLQKNFLFNARTAKRQYLLRGLMKCELCGLTYIGNCRKETLKKGNKKLGIEPGEIERAYYVCNGKHNGRTRFGTPYQGCPSKNVSSEIENVVFSDIIDFLRNPGDILAELQDVLSERRQQPEKVQEKLAKAQSLLDAKQNERNRLLTLYRRGLVNDNALERQLKDVDREEDGIRKQVEGLQEELRQAQVGLMQFDSLEPLLLELRHRLEEPLSWEIKRQLVETLVESITVETHGEGKDRYAKVVVVYCFEQPEMDNRAIFLPTDIHTDVRADIS